MSRYHWLEYRNRLTEQLRFFMVFFYSRSRTFNTKGVFEQRVIGCYESVVSISGEATSLGATQLAVAIAEMLAHSASAALRNHGYSAIRPVCQFVGLLVETALIARTTANTEVEAAVMSTIELTFRACGRLTKNDQNNHRGFTLDDPAELLLEPLHRYVRGERNMLFEEKSRIFANRVSITEAAAYREVIRAKFTEWSASDHAV